MKKNHLIVLVILTAIICFFGNIKSSNGQNAPVTPESFTKRLNEFNSAHPNMGDFEPLFYASCQHKMNDFIKRLNEFKSAYPNMGDFEPLYYASCQHKMNDFVRRLNEFNSAYPNMGDFEPLHYAASENSL